MLGLLAATTVLAPTTIALPNGPVVMMDYIAIDRAHDRLWVPAGNTGNVDVIDTRTGKVTAITGFDTERPIKPGRPFLGPSSVTLGDGEAWIGNRAGKQLCVVHEPSLTRGPCLPLPALPDGIAWVRSTREVWATTPFDKSITIVGTTPAPSVTGTIKLEGKPEGYAVDEGRGLFFTNLEDANKTLAIDLRTHAVVRSWPSGCDSEGPRGLALDARRRWLFVACTNGALVRDLAHGGAILGRLQTALGVDGIDELPEKGLLYVASGRDAKLTIARVGHRGSLTPVATTVTGKGARVVVADQAGKAYVADSLAGRIVVAPPP